MACEYCDIIQGNSNAIILVEDIDVIVAIRDHVATPGQISVIPKEHHTILEMVPDVILEKCSVLANKVSIAVFESLGAQGTNIVIQNGLGAGQTVPHFSIEVIPRQENDGLNLQWEPKQMMEDELEATFDLLKETLPTLSAPKEEPTTETPTEKVTSKKGKDNYLLKSLKRIP